MSTPAPQLTRPTPPQYAASLPENSSEREVSASMGILRRSSIVRNVLSNWSGYIFSVVVGFFLSPYIVNHLGTVGYGVWSLVISLTGYLGLLDLGVRGAVTRYVARFHAQGDHQRSSQVASAAMAIFAGTGIATIGLSALLAVAVIGHMNIPPQYLAAARLVLVLTGVSIAASLINGVYGGMVVALQRFDLSNGIEIGTTGFRALSVVLSLHYGRGLVMLACIQAAFSLGRLVVNFVLLRKLYPEVRVRPRSADPANLRLIFSFSVFSFLLHVSFDLIYASDLVVIGAYLPVAAVTFYTIGASLVEYTRSLVSGISQTMTPLASSLEARQGTKGVRELVLENSPWGTVVALPVAITFLLRGNTFIELWMGRQFAEPSGEVLRILALATVFGASNLVVASVLLGISRHKPLGPALLVEGVCNLGLSTWLVRKMGIIGVAWGTLIPSLLTNLAFIPWYLRRGLAISPLGYAYLAWGKTAPAGPPFSAVSYTPRHIW